MVMRGGLKQKAHYDASCFSTIKGETFSKLFIGSFQL